MNKLSEIRKQIVIKQAILYDKYALRVKQLDKILNKGKSALLTASRDNLSINENKQRNTELVKWLNKIGAKYKLMKGIWTKVEKSFLVNKIEFKKAVKIGDHFNQDSIIYCYPSKNIYLVDLKKRVMKPAIIKDLKPFEKGMHTKIRDVGLELEIMDEEFSFSEIEKIEK